MDRQHRAGLAEYQTTSQILIDFSLADRVEQIAFPQMLFDLEAQDEEGDDLFPDGLIDLLLRANAITQETEITSGDNEPVQASGSTTEPTTVEELNTAAEQLTSDTRSVRVAARDEMALLLSNCTDIECATAVLNLLPDGPSLTGTGYRITLGMAIAISRQPSTGFLSDPDLATVRSEIQSRLEAISTAQDATLRDYASRAVGVVSTR